MTKRSVGIAAAVAAAVLLIRAPSVYAHGSVGGEKVSKLEEMSDGANLVFEGEVTEVTYRQARFQGGEGELPYTIVTYKVKEVLRGESPGESFTMRFPGGADGKGHFVEVSGVPVFQTGEQDVLFVRGNGEKGCPLVNCEWGRFRISKGVMYNTHGSPVRALGKMRAVSRGLPPEEFKKFSYPAPSFDELMKNPDAQKVLKEKNLKPEEARRRYESEAPKQIEVRRVFPKLAATTGEDKLAATEPAPAVKGALDTSLGLDAQGLKAQAEADVAADAQAKLPELATALKLEPRALGRDKFVSELKGAIGKAKRKPAKLKSINPNAEIVINLTGPKVAPKLAAPKAEARPATPEEEAELNALKANKFNPVLKKP